MQALNTAATARGYSPTIGETSCEQLMNRPGAIRRAKAASACSCAGFIGDHNRQMASASIPLDSSLPNRLLRAALVEPDQLIALAVDPFRNLLDTVARHQRLRLMRAGDVEQFVDRKSLGAPAAAHDRQRLAVSDGGQQAHLGAAFGDDRIGAHGGAVDQSRRVGKQLAHVEAGRRRRRLQRVEESFGRILRGGGGLAGDESGRLGRQTPRNR